MKLLYKLFIKYILAKLDIARNNTKNQGDNFIILSLDDLHNLPNNLRKLDKIYVCMLLHSLAWKQSLSLVNELSKSPAQIILVDYCLAERNLYILGFFICAMLEKSLGQGSYAKYKTFMQNGGIEALVHLINTQSQNIQRKNLGLGAIRILKLQ